MKKFLTVLLVIAVMFTFSFGSAFAAYPAGDPELQNVVDTHEAAVKAIQDKYNDNLAALNRDYANKVAAPEGGADKGAWTKACDVALEDAKAVLNAELAQAYNTLAAEEAKVTNPLGWYIGETYTDTDYVNVSAALALITKKQLDAIDAGEAIFDAIMEKTVNLVKNYDLSKFVADDDYNDTGKSSYQTAVDAQADALKLLASYKYPTNSTTDIENIYKITGVGTQGEKEEGSFYNAIKDLKTTISLKTDEAKIAYAKNFTVNKVKALIENKRAEELKTQNDIIFAQSISSKPNQKEIDKANEEIEKINKKYDAYAKVWDYRLANGTYKVESEVVNLYHGTNKIADIGTFTKGVFDTTGIAAGWDSLIAALAVAQGEVIVGYVADLEREAATLKATIYVDGDVAIDVDAALADAVKETYMTGSKASLSAILTNSAVHARAHQLLGTTCAGGSKTDKVTVNDKKYDNVSQWGNGKSYSSNNGDAVDAIVDDVTAAIKAAGSIAEAEAAFVAAYDKYAAVFTVADQQKLFAYNGELYKKDDAAKADLDAYITYKVALMDDAIPGVEAALKAYYTKAKLVEEVNNAADLDAAVADAKAVVDALKTNKAIKAEDKALRDKIVASARPATLARKDEIIALYDEYCDFDEYASKVGYNNLDSDSVKTLLTDDVKRLASLDKDILDDLVKAIEKDGKVTLEDRNDVKALVDGIDAYNNLYADNGYGLVADYTAAKDYEALIFDLDVIAVNNQIAALPAYGATTAQIKAARDAVDALGFKGICKINKNMLTKLNRLEDSLGYEVEALKITASSTAKKGSITVKWTVKGNAAAADGYQIWKSTKKNSGYKKAFTTTKKSYKNTKGLKKGTRYYYKVRAYKVVDGKNVYSDWSNKAYRKAK